MTSILLRTDDILRQRFGAGWTTDRRTLAALAMCVVLFGGFYGGVMGSFGGFNGDRAWQVVVSATKVPLLLLATFAVAAPSFLVINVLVGLRDDVPEVLRALIAAQAGVAIVLASLAPLTAMWYLTSGDYLSAILFNGVIFFIASVAGQHLLRGYYAPLVARRRRHRAMCRLWLGLFAFVGIQMAWMLRPFVGDPGSPVQFFRSGAWGNAYTVVLEVIWNVLFQ